MAIKLPAPRNIRCMRRIEVIDAVAEIDRAIAQLQEERARLLRQFEGKEGTFYGEEARVMAYNMDTAFLDHHKVRRVLGEDGYRKCFTKRRVHVVRVTPANSKEA